MRPILIAVVFGSLIVLLLTGPWSFDSPVEPPTAVPAWVFSTATVRQPTLQPRIQLAGFAYRCSDCHDLFRSPPETTRPLTQHTNIVLKHGINTRCFNCHHPAHRDAYVDDYGREIPYDQPQLLCAKCHGPVYRDWLSRSHGRTNGYWNASMGPMQRRRCVECHDPHQPPFPPMTPAPPPHTLRMGDQVFPSEPAEVRNPLRVYRWDESRPEKASDEHAPDATPSALSSPPAEPPTMDEPQTTDGLQPTGRPHTTGGAQQTDQSHAVDEPSIGTTSGRPEPPQDVPTRSSSGAGASISTDARG